MGLEFNVMSDSMLSRISEVLANLNNLREGQNYISLQQNATKPKYL